MATPLLGWATDALDSNSKPTKVIVPPEVQATGLVRGEPMGRQWFNYIINYILGRLDGVGVAAANASHEVRLFTVAQPNLTTANGWKDMGTFKIGSVDVHAYEQVGV